MIEQKVFVIYDAAAERIAKKVSRDFPTDWQDVKQEILIGLWKAPVGKPERYYWRVMSHDAADYMRKERRFYSDSGG